MTHASTWTFRCPHAELRCRGLSGRVDVARPDLGLHGIAVNSQSLETRLLRVRRNLATPRGGASSKRDPAWPLSVADAYVRGGDLVAGYQPTDDWPYAPQIYWRAEERSIAANSKTVIGSVSLLVSVQTHLLDTRPRIVVGSELKCVEAFQVPPESSGRGEPVTDRRTIKPTGGACCILRRLADLPISYAEIMPATDFHELQIWQDGQGECHVEWELFSEFLEKGVIRRARIEAIFLPRERDLELAADCCTSILERPLPLTT